MADGLRLAADLYLPEGDGPFAALLEALPYRKDDLTASYAPDEYLGSWPRAASPCAASTCAAPVRRKG